MKSKRIFSFMLAAVMLHGRNRSLHRAETISGENGRIAIEEYVTHGTCRNDHMNGQTGAVGMEV